MYLFLVIQQRMYGKLWGTIWMEMFQENRVNRGVARGDRLCSQSLAAHVIDEAEGASDSRHLDPRGTDAVCHRRGDLLAVESHASSLGAWTKIEKSHLRRWVGIDICQRQNESVSA